MDSINEALSIKPTESQYLLLKSEILESIREYKASLEILSSLMKDAKSKNIENAYNRVKKLVKQENLIRNFYPIFC